MITILVAMIVGFVVMFTVLMVSAALVSVWPLLLVIGVYLMYRDHRKQQTPG